MDSFRSLGFHFTRPEELLLRLLPAGEAISMLYSDFVLPDTIIKNLTLEETICHNRILISQIQKLGCSRNKLLRERNDYYYRLRRGTASSETEDRPIVDIVVDIQQVRLSYFLHKDRLIKISAHYKKKLFSDGKALPNTLKSDSPPLPQPAQTEVARRTR